MIKVCAKCKQEKLLDEFYVRSDRNRPSPRCKSCQAEDARSESSKEAKRKYDQKNKEKIAERRKEHYIKNKEKLDAQNRSWQDRNQDRIRDNRYRKTYGISLTQYNEMLEEQDHSCAVCHRHESEFKTRLAVDHDHVTGEVRGLLCSNCNHRVIGRHRDPNILLSAFNYLNRVFTGWFVPKNKKRRSKKKLQKMEISDE